MTTVTYIPRDAPLVIASSARGEYAVFGGYHVDFDDGFRVLIPHAAYTHTISAEPVDLEAEPHFRELLLTQADEIRKAERKKAA